MRQVSSQFSGVTLIAARCCCAVPIHVDRIDLLQRVHVMSPMMSHLSLNFCATLSENVSGKFDVGSRRLAGSRGYRRRSAVDERQCRLRGCT